MSSYNTNRANMLIRRNDGKIIGRVKDGVFYKNVCGSIHMLKNPLGWSYDACAVKQAKQLGARYLIVNDKENGNKYRTTPEDFLQYSEPVPWDKNQRVLRLLFWQQKKSNK